MRKKNAPVYFLILFISVIFSACASTQQGNSGRLQTFPIYSSEPEWIRNGEPIEYEGMEWFAVDDVETLLDSEMLLLGEYRGVQFFVEKVDVRPFNRLYTKFARNKFRFYERKIR